MRPTYNQHTTEVAVMNEYGDDAIAYGGTDHRSAKGTFYLWTEATVTLDQLEYKITRSGVRVSGIAEITAGHASVQGVIRFSIFELLGDGDGIDPFDLSRNVLVELLASRLQGKRLRSLIEVTQARNRHHDDLRAQRSRVREGKRKIKARKAAKIKAITELERLFAQRARVIAQSSFYSRLYCPEKDPRTRWPRIAALHPQEGLDPVPIPHVSSRATTGSEDAQR